MNPFTDTSSLALSSLGEIRLIEQLRQWLGFACPPAPEGIGDDAAVYASKRNTQELVTVDALVWQKHFDDNATPEQAAHKLLHRNLSDIAAMGGLPDRAVVSLVCSKTIRVDWLQRFYHHLGEEARDRGVKIVGGDVTEAEGELFIATLTLIGHSSRPILRTGGTDGDFLYVTGSLGGSILGRHLSFEARLAEGLWLSEKPEVKAMIDLSDGLGKDALSLTPKNGGVVLNAEAVPCSKAAHERASLSGRQPLTHALSDGEDHELLFVLDKSADREDFMERWQRNFSIPLTCIGQLSASALPFALRDSDGNDLMKLAGFAHF